MSKIVPVLVSGSTDDLALDRLVRFLRGFLRLVAVLPPTSSAIFEEGIADPSFFFDS
jgi:hypothetical protein